MARLLSMQDLTDPTSYIPNKSGDRIRKFSYWSVQLNVYTYAAGYLQLACYKLFPLYIDHYNS